MKKYIIILLVVIGIEFLFAQNRDSYWMLGDCALHNNKIGRIQLFHFTNDTVEIEQIDSTISFRYYAGVISKENGDLAFYTNGLYLMNATHQRIVGDDHFNPGPANDTVALQQGCLPVIQGMVVLPDPGRADRYYVIHQKINFFNNMVEAYGTRLSYTIVDMSLNGGLGVVTDKNVHLTSQLMELGQLSSVKHANGRDWWIMVPLPNKDYCICFLLSPSGISGPFTVDMWGVTWGNEGFRGNALFSPDGSRYARYDGKSQLHIYDFDRCTGLFTGHDSVGIYPPNVWTNARWFQFAYSPNSRFLYGTMGDTLLQFDLLAPNIQASKTVVGIYDGFMDPILQSDVNFDVLDRAKDGKIYIISQSHYLHVIHNPDVQGVACNLEQHCIQTPLLACSFVPYHPNYNLGAVKQSACDTIFATSIGEGVQTIPSVHLYPNPVDDILHISIQGSTGATLRWVLVNSLGETVIQTTITPDAHLSTQALSQGMYYYQVYEGAQRIGAGKVVVQHE